MKLGGVVKKILYFTIGLLFAGGCSNVGKVEVLSINSGVLDTLPQSTWGIQFDAKGQGNVYVDIHRLAYGEDSLVCTDTVWIDGDSTYSAQIPVDWRHPVTWDGHFYALVRWLDQQMYSDTAWLGQGEDIPPTIEITGALITVNIWSEYDSLCEVKLVFTGSWPGVLKSEGYYCYCIPEQQPDYNYFATFVRCSVPYSDLVPQYDTITLYAFYATLAGKDSASYTVRTGEIKDTSWF